MSSLLQQLMLVCALVLQLLPAASAITASGHTSLRAGARRAAAAVKEQLTTRKRLGKGDDDDDADEGDDDTEDAEPAGENDQAPADAEASAAEVVNVSVPAAPEAVRRKCWEESLEAQVTAAHQKLVDNLDAQVKTTSELANLTDEEASKEEIDSNVKIVANETYSPALADFLGDMWTEMRTFSKPMYEEHLQEKLTELRMEQVELERKFNASRDALSAYKADHKFQISYPPAQVSSEAVVSNPVTLVAASTNLTVGDSNPSSTEEEEDDDDDDDDDDDTDDLSTSSSVAKPTAATPIAAQR